MKLLINACGRFLRTAFFIFCFFIGKSSAINKQEIIYIYNGPGVSEESLRHTQHTFESMLSEHYLIKTIQPMEVREGNWVHNAVLFIMPGGADLPYLEHLGSLGNKKIKAFVEKGGAYLGFCAGAYYGSQSIAFAVNTPLEVTGKRELSFFPGKAVGPTLATYDYKTNSGARAAVLQWESKTDFPFEKKFVVYYNGGCHFEDADQYKNVQVLANYASTAHPKAAIIEISVGKGRVILSGVHCEYAPELLSDKDPYLSSIKSQLLANDVDRQALMGALIKHLGIKNEN